MMFINDTGKKLKMHPASCNHFKEFYNGITATIPCNPKFVKVWDYMVMVTCEGYVKTGGRFR